MAALGVHARSAWDQWGPPTQHPCATPVSPALHIWLKKRQLLSHLLCWPLCDSHCRLCHGSPAVLLIHLVLIPLGSISTGTICTYPWPRGSRAQPQHAATRAALPRHVQEPLPLPGVAPGPAPPMGARCTGAHTGLLAHHTCVNLSLTRCCSVMMILLTTQVVPEPD